jgi:hypothetical protein
MENAPISISLPTGEVKTAVPLIADGTWALWRLEKISQNNVETKDEVLRVDGSRGNSGTRITFEFKLVSPVPTTEGDTLNPGDFGASFFDHVPLYAKPDSKKPKWFMDRICSRIDGLLGTADRGNSEGKPERPEFTPDLVPILIGQELYAKMKVRTGDYKGNEIADVRFPGDYVVN